VFATMLENAVRVCKATFGNIFRWDGECGHLVATHNTPPAFAEYRRRSSLYYPDPKTGVGRMVATKRRFRSLMLRRSRLTWSAATPPSWRLLNLVAFARISPFRC
jgi:hypothetical protein